MTYLQTDYFIHVAQTKSITKTASELYISPPAISKQITLLEEELGFALFLRGPRGMELTPAGEIMYNHFINSRAMLERAVNNARALESASNDEIHMGISAKWGLTRQMHQLQRLMSVGNNPTQIQFHSCFNPAGSSLLERGELDIALCLANDILVYVKSHELEYAEITQVPKIFLYSMESSVARIPNLQPQDFKEIPLLVISSKAAIDAHQNNINLCHRLGFQPNTIFKDSLDDALMGVTMNEGFFICDNWFEPTAMTKFGHIIVPDHHSVVLAWWKHNKNPHLKKLIECCTSSIDW